MIDTGRRQFSALSIMMIMAAPAAMGQVTTGLVTGTVKDAQDAIIPGATVSLISEARGTKVGEVVTSDKGDYIFPNVPGDTYTIQVELAGFKTSRRPGVSVSPGDRATVPRSLLRWAR